MGDVRCWMTCAAIALVLSGRGHAWAQEAHDPASDERARALFLGGQAHYDEGQFGAAATEFEEAYRLSQRPQLLYNIYVARRDAGQRAEAAAALRSYLDRVPDAENASSLRARLVVLEQELAAQQAHDAETAPETEPETPALAPSSDGAPSAVGWIVSGVGAATLIAGAVTGGLALDAHASLDAACGPAHDACPADVDARVSQGRALAAATDGLSIGGGVVLGAGIVLLLVLHEPTEAPPVTAACGPSGCAISVQGRF